MGNIRERIARLSPEERDLLELILTKQGASSAKTKRIPRRESSGPCALSFAQERLWFLDQLYPNSPIYNICSVLRLEGDLNREALHKSLNAIVGRHESLRTTFTTSADGVPMQVVNDDRSVELKIIDLSALSSPNQETEMRRLLEEENKRPFNLSSDVMIRATLLVLSPMEHILHIAMHHIASDGWSAGVFRRELTAYYEAFVSGKPISLPELKLTLQYADFAVWQRKWLQGDVLESQLSYWRDQLADAPPVIELPTDRPRPSNRTFCGAHHRFVIPAGLTRDLMALSNREKVTLFMTLLAAFKTLIYRYTGQEKVVVGSPIANRNHAEIEGLIGFFVNTLAMHTDLSGNPSFRDLLGRVRKTCLEAYEYQDLPFEKLVEELRPERNLTHSPIFQILFVLQNAPRASLELSGLELTPVENNSSMTKFDLTLSVIEVDRELKSKLSYRTDLFDADTIERMAGHFLTLLEGIVANPEQQISELPILTESELNQMLVEWNDTQSEYTAELCVHELFEAQAQRTPDSIALVFGDQQLSYNELNERANQLAHHLRSLGVVAEERIGIFLDRSIDMVTAFMGILKSGGAYVPLDPELPEERLSFMLDDLQLHSILTQQEYLDRLPDLLSNIICMDSDWGAISHESKENPDREASPHNLAYILYTSGSTGKPKGVAVEHRQLLNYVSAAIERLELMPGFSYAMVQPFTVDSCITTIFPPLCAGGILHIISRDDSLDPRALSNYFSKHSIDCLKIAPSHLAALHSSSSSEYLLPGKRLILGGEVLRWEWVQEIKNLSKNLLPMQASAHSTDGFRMGSGSYASDDLIIFNHYGPTETTVAVLVYKLDEERKYEGHSITPLGRPLGNTRVYILDSYMQPVPIGVPGELYIGGANVARGYLNRPELTTESFIPDTFSDVLDARLYKSGDIVRYLPDGNIEFIGRMDNQVKIRGFRIELGEIETTLSQHPDVQEVVAIVREDRPNDERLVAYIVPGQDRECSIDDMRCFVAEKLPEYMVPSAFVILDALPLTPHGKINRRELPEPDRTLLVSDEGFVAPRTPVEQKIAEIWCQVLGLDQVGIHDNFFDLGGHSLLATQVISRLRLAFQMEIPLRILFMSATMAELADFIETYILIVRNSQSSTDPEEDDLEEIEI